MNYKLILDTLDRLASKLVDYGHTWSQKDREMYERSVREINKEYKKDL